MKSEDELVEKFATRLHGTWHHPRVSEVSKILDEIRASNIGCRGINRVIEKLPHELTGASGDTLKSIREQLGRLCDEKARKGELSRARCSLGAITRPRDSEIWRGIENEFGITKRRFGKKLSFVENTHARKIIFRDVEDSFILASSGYPKPAVILAGGVIEELLRLYLVHKGISPSNDNFDGYIKTCQNKRLLKAAISRLSDSVRHFRNLVHLSREQTRKHTISKATAKGAVSSVFTIANEF